MTETEKSTAIEYAESVNPPAELEFFSKEQMDKLKLEREKMDRSRVFVDSMFEKDDFEEQMQKAELEGHIYGPSEMSNMNAKFRAIDDGIGQRIDLKDSIVTKTGQRIIMSGRLQTLLGFLTDGYMLKDESDELISALQADGVPGPEIDRVNAAMNQYGAIIMQRGVFAVLKMPLEEALGKTLPLFSASQLSSLSRPAPIPPPMPAHGASLESLKAKLSKPIPAPSPATSGNFKKELDREVRTPELTAPKSVPPKPMLPKPMPMMPKPQPTPPPVPKPQPSSSKKLEMPDLEPGIPAPNKSAMDLEDAAWRLSNRVVAPKTSGDMPAPQPLATPKVRNRQSRYGLSDLSMLKHLTDLNKIEAAHLRQGPLATQIKTIKNKIADLARANNMLPVSLLPAFVQSPLFQIYLKAGAMMIERNMGTNKVAFESVMNELESQGIDTLTLQEFEAVADLKKDLESMSGL